MNRELVPEWVPEQFFVRIEPTLIENGEYVFDWFISKVTLIAVLNYIRSKGYKCEWVEKAEGEYLIKISQKTNNE